MSEFEIEPIPNGIVSYLLRATNPVDPTQINHREVGHYWVTDISKCLRQSYYQITCAPIDADSKLDTESMWSLQCRKYLHNLTYSYRWRELDMEKEVYLHATNEKVMLHGRLDMYDYKMATIIDLKTTNAVKWQLLKGLIPRKSDVHQIQCYSSLYYDTIRVAHLTLLYADMKNMIPFNVPIVDKQPWIADRLLTLHVSLKDKRLPPAEVSTACDYCPYRRRCDEHERTCSNEG